MSIFDTTAVKRGRIALLAAIAVVIVLAVAGCNGGGGGNDAPPATSTVAWVQKDATYVGRAACRDCHSAIDDEYATSMKGDNVGRHAEEAGCNGCHVTGYGQPTGGKLDGSTPNLDGIGCEDCHGPGSKHLAANTPAERRAQITRTPPAIDTCGACHSDRLNTPDGYRQGALFLPAKLIDASTVHDTNPGSVRGPHYAAGAFLYGREGYGDTDEMPSPHKRLANSCVDCHKPGISPTTGKIDHSEAGRMPNLDTTRAECVTCHAGRSGETTVQDGVNALMIKLGGEDPNNPGHFDSSMKGGMFAAFVAAHNIATSSNNNPDDPYVIRYKAARWNYRFVYGDHSLGVHNPAFAMHLLEKAEALLSE